MEKMIIPKVKQAFWLLVLGLLLSPSTTLACSICYGDPDAPVTKGLSWAIVALAALVVAVLGGVVSFFVHMSRRAALLMPEEAPVNATLSPTD